MSKQPSKYHNLVFVGKGIEGADELGYKYMWDSSHRDLLPTTTVKIGYGAPYCVYCQKIALPIQAGLRNNKSNYDTTGYTCTCESAEAEKQYKQELQKMEEEQRDQRFQLQESFKERLKIDPVALLKIKQAYELKEASRKNEQHSYFSTVNGIGVYH